MRAFGFSVKKKHNLDKIFLKKFGLRITKKRETIVKKPIAADSPVHFFKEYMTGSFIVFNSFGENCM